MSKPSRVFKPEAFKKEKPVAAVILPIFKGEASPQLARLLQELKHQTFQDFEVLVVEGAEPNGFARNLAVLESRAPYFILIDETTHLGHERVLEILMAPFLGKVSLEKVGATGASILLPPSSSWAQRQYAMVRRFESPSVQSWWESDQVQHPCMVIPQNVYKEVGWESDWLITGTDNDLRQRLRAAGYKMYLGPDAWGFYLPPKKISDMLNKAYRKGKGAAFAALVFPGLFETPTFAGRPVKSRAALPGWKIASAASKLFRPQFFLNPVALLYEWILAAGFVAGWLQWKNEKTAEGRPDLPGWNPAGKKNTGTA